MVKFEVNGKLGKGCINLPTSVGELVDDDYLAKLTSHISVADNYSLIALLHKEKLSNFVIAGRNNKGEMSTAVVPIFIKSGYIDIKSDSTFIKSIHYGYKVVISPSALSLGYHVAVPTNDLNMGKFATIIDGDKDVMRKALALNTDVYFVEFKLIPNNEIVGIYNPISPITNPFSIKLETTTNVSK